MRHNASKAAGPSKAHQPALWSEQFPPPGKKPPHPWASKRKAAAPRPGMEPSPPEITPHLMSQHGKIRTSTPKRAHMRAEETRLRDVINLAGTPKQMSNEKQAFFAGQAEEAVSAEDDMSSFLEIGPGALIETRRNNLAVLGIVVGEATELNIRHLVTMNPSGETWLHRPSDVTFVIPSCVPSGLAQRCGTGDIPADDHELHARMQALRQLREYVRSFEQTYSEMHTRGDNVWEQIKAPKRDQWAETSVAEVAHMLETTPTIRSIYATHRMMMADSLHFIPRDPYMLTQKFDVRPAEDVELIEKIMEWKREDNPALKTFAAKAQALLAKNVAKTKESALEEPQLIKHATKWSKTDTTILNFLVKSLRTHRSLQVDPYTLGQIAILRMIYPDMPEISVREVYETLVGLGVMSPWQDLLVLDKNVTLVEEPERHSGTARAKEEERIVEATLANLSKPSTSSPGALGPEDFYPSDVLESVRRDWGTMRAYVIDDASAKELDDAVSIEPLEKEPGSYWVHVHIANPTASLPPTHALAKRALREGLTEYSMHRTIPIFPESLTHHRQHGWSLGATLETKQPARVLTFSAKVNENGDILDYEVRAGLLKEIRVLSYDAVNKVIGHQMKRHHPFGELQKAESPEVKLTANETRDLRLLHTVAEGFRARRARDGVMVQVRYQSDVAFGAFPKGSMTPNIHNLQEFRGFLDLTKFTSTSMHEMELGANSLVAEAMKIASRVGSRFALEHDVEVIRRALEPSAFHDEISREHAMALRLDGSSSIKIEDYVSLVKSMSAGEYTLEPKGHWAVGALEGEGYTRITSPLRRAVDLVAHWQLHQPLLRRKEANPRPIFTREWLEAYKTSFAALEKQSKARERNGRAFWSLLAFKKWLAGELRGVERPPQEVFEGVVTERARATFESRVRAYEVTLEEFGIRGRLLAPDDLAPGEGVKIKVKNVALGIKPQVEFVPA